MNKQPKLTFDDVLLVPQYSDIRTREDIDLSQEFLAYKMDIPIISSNMDLVTGAKMALAMREAGGLGILHRFYNSWEEEQNDIDIFCGDCVAPVAISVGIKDYNESMAKIDYVSRTWRETPIVCIDVAHGYHERVKELIKIIRDKYFGCQIIAGNVATWEGYLYLANAGADAIKVGIGPGSACTTRIVTGFGYPQLASILDIAEKRREWLDPKLPAIICDGGIRSSGDIVKALAAGADVVMLGNLLAGTNETPGEVIEGVSGRRYRRYRGQSIFGTNGERYVKEGVSGFVEEKGPVANVLKYLVGGIRSGLSYAGARNLTELRENAEFVYVSENTILESKPRLMEVL
jgi:IMP dehydrogenase